ncbi:MAG: HAMP domain-containing histidine kinase [Acidobacteria bacterium]|nr:HAMP domain-containing histidine kinase [Acidobacteriota bacterium]
MLYGQPESRRLLVLFAATTLVPTIGLGVLGWRMMEQDLALASQRAAERRDHAADLAAAALSRTLADLEREVRGTGSGVNKDVVRIVFEAQGIVERGGAALPYYPATRPVPELPPDLFSAADNLEFRSGDSRAAIPILEELSKRKDPAIRAAALVRLARNYRKTGEWKKAVDAFHALARLEEISVNGLPAGLVARQGAGLLLESTGRKEELRREAAALYSELCNSRWLLTRTSYEFAVEQARRWLGEDSSNSESPDRLALAEAAESIWKEWRQGVPSPHTAQRTVRVRQQSILALSHRAQERMTVLLVSPQFLQSLKELVALRQAHGMDFALTDAEGRVVFGNPQVPIALQSVRTASATRLPWTLHVISAASTEPTVRSTMLLAGLAFMAVLILGGGYFVHRAVSHEVALAKLQTDFVAAVSHEFRTPLTTMRQLSEMLVHDRVSSDDRRRQFYEVLLRESDRLHRFVDSLLNFGRMEAGRMSYRFEPLDPAALVRDVVGEFRQEASKNGYVVELAESSALPTIPADRESLSRVLWNLLDNAVKYSPECHTVWVEMEGAGKRVMVRVRDRGIGIPASEQKQIFGKFVRGAASKSAAIHGSGVGLAMARQIVRAHKGEIAVESKVGEGSVFTVLLPVAE